jgi:ABC-2 type transport system ATP-binding protein
MTEPAINCIDLGKSFGKRPAVRNVNLALARGSTCALVGANGAGKTTLLKILATLIVPSYGSARICGK